MQEYSPTGHKSDDNRVQPANDRVICRSCRCGVSGSTTPDGNALYSCENCGTRLPRQVTRTGGAV